MVQHRVVNSLASLKESLRPVQLELPLEEPKKQDKLPESGKREKRDAS